MPTISLQQYEMEKNPEAFSDIPLNLAITEEVARLTAFANANTPAFLIQLAHSQHRIVESAVVAAERKNASSTTAFEQSDTQLQKTLDSQAVQIATKYLPEGFLETHLFLRLADKMELHPDLELHLFHIFLHTEPQSQKDDIINKLVDSGNMNAINLLSRGGGNATQDDRIRIFKHACKTAALQENLPAVKTILAMASSAGVPIERFRDNSEAASNNPCRIYLRSPLDALETEARENSNRVTSPVTLVNYNSLYDSISRNSFIAQAAVAGNTARGL